LLRQKPGVLKFLRRVAFAGRSGGRKSSQLSKHLRGNFLWKKTLGSLLGLPSSGMPRTRRPESSAQPGKVSGFASKPNTQLCRKLRRLSAAVATSREGRCHASNITHTRRLRQPAIASCPIDDALTVLVDDGRQRLGPIGCQTGLNQKFLPANFTKRKTGWSARSMMLLLERRNALAQFVYDIVEISDCILEAINSIIQAYISALTGRLRPSISLE